MRIWKSVHRFFVFPFRLIHNGRRPNSNERRRSFCNKMDAEAIGTQQRGQVLDVMHARGCRPTTTRLQTNERKDERRTGTTAHRYRADAPHTDIWTGTRHHSYCTCTYARLLHIPCKPLRISGPVTGTTATVYVRIRTNICSTYHINHDRYQDRYPIPQLLCMYVRVRPSPQDSGWSSDHHERRETRRHSGAHQSAGTDR